MVTFFIGDPTSVLTSTSPSAECISMAGCSNWKSYRIGTIGGHDGRTSGMTVGGVIVALAPIGVEVSCLA
jgi:hypothetical protein